MPNILPFYTNHALENVVTMKSFVTNTENDRVGSFPARKREKGSTRRGGGFGLSDRISSLSVGFQYSLRDVRELVANIYVDWAM